MSGDSDSEVLVQRGMARRVPALGRPRVGNRRAAEIQCIAVVAADDLDDIGIVDVVLGHKR